jgi:environmental stress-induced protein Ves
VRGVSEPGVTVVTRARQRRVRWRNGAGWTTELAARPEDGEFEWRISVAEIAGDCEFSRFPGVDRGIVVIGGAGFMLDVEGAPPAVLRAGGPPHAFAGEGAARCTVAGGPSRAFNVMTRRGRIDHALSTCSEGQELARPAGTGWAVYAISGAARVGGHAVAAGEAAIVEAVSVDMPALSLAVAGELVLVRLRSFAARR